MRMCLSISFVCLAALSSVASAQSAASTGRTVGIVLVNRGSGFVQAPPGTPLARGDVVSVRRRGQVVLEYENGCTQTVKPGRARTVDPADCLKERSAASSASDAPLLGGVLIAGAGVGAAIALGLTPNDGAPGGGGHRNAEPVSR